MNFNKDEDGALRKNRFKKPNQFMVKFSESYL